MPAFLLIVGVAIPFSLASRRRRGQGLTRIAAHAVWRSALLVLLGIFIMSNGAKRTDFNFINVLGADRAWVLAGGAAGRVWLADTGAGDRLYFGGRLVVVLSLSAAWGGI